jgi:hypothetical protein
MAEVPTWPKYFPPADELLTWLATVKPQLPAGSEKHLAALRWLVLTELDRTAPEPPEPHGLVGYE